MKTSLVAMVLLTSATLAACADAWPFDALKRLGEEPLAVAADKTYEQVGDAVPSPDGKRTAFLAKRGDKMLVVIDGVEGKEYDHVERLHFSADGSRVGYIAELPDGRVAVIDGVAAKRYIGGVRDLVFSPDGKHAAFVAGRGTPLNNHIDDVVVIDGVEGAPFPGIVSGSLRYSPDGKRLAFAAEVPAGNPSGREVRVFVDGKPISKGYDDLKQGPDDEAVLLFSPDGRRVAYLVSRGEKYLVGVDGQEGKGYSFVKLDSVQFSPDGGRVAYVAEPDQGGAYRLVVDGKEGAAYDDISDLRFSADGSRFAYTAQRNGATYRVTDKGEESRMP